MTLKKIKVYHLFWLVALLILIIGLIDPDHTLDINVHDTYIVMANFHAAITLFLFYFLNGVGYWLIQKVFKKQLIRPLTIIHSIIVIGSFVVYWLIIFLNVTLFTSDPNFPLLSYDDQLINITLVLASLLIVFAAMPIFIVNLLIGFFRKSKHA